MSVSIGICFPTGRFHATPWGHHVNEGLPEWPPSPWRLLRALVATWKTKLAGEPSVEREIPGVVRELAQKPPVFSLPPATLGHTRHYMPLMALDDRKRTKVFDAFVAIAPEADIVLHWADATLTDAQGMVLRLVLSQLGYFGRAESWCSARLLAGLDLSLVNCVPGPVDGGDPVRVLGADPKTWSEWSFVKKIGKPDPPWNLLAETAALHSERWSDPPGSQWITYARRPDCFAIPTSGRVRTDAEDLTRFSVARFALDVAKGRIPLPLVTQTLPLGEVLRHAVVGRFMGVVRRRLKLPGTATPKTHPDLRSETLSGKDECGKALQSHHHAYYLPTDEDGDGRIDHLTIYAAGRFSRDEVSALDGLRKVQFDESEFRLLLVGLGTPDDFRSPLFREAPVWASVTPFLVTRHRKRRGTKRDPQEFFQRDGLAVFVKAVLEEEWERLQQRRPDLRDILSPTIEPIFDPKAEGVTPFRMLEYYRGRRKSGDDGFSRPFGAFRLIFDRPVAGPICLGHSSHFGLGLFLPIGESRG